MRAFIRLAPAFDPQNVCGGTSVVAPKHRGHPPSERVRKPIRLKALSDGFGHRACLDDWPPGSFPHAALAGNVAASTHTGGRKGRESGMVGHGFCPRRDDENSEFLTTVDCDLPHRPLAATRYRALHFMLCNRSLHVDYSGVFSCAYPMCSGRPLRRSPCLLRPLPTRTLIPTAAQSRGTRRSVATIMTAARLLPFAGVSRACG